MSQGKCEQVLGWLGLFCNCFACVYQQPASKLPSIKMSRSKFVADLDRHSGLRVCINLHLMALHRFAFPWWAEERRLNVIEQPSQLPICDKPLRLTCEAKQLAERAERVALSWTELPKYRKINRLATPAEAASFPCKRHLYQHLNLPTRSFDRSNS